MFLVDENIKLTLEQHSNFQPLTYKGLKTSLILQIRTELKTKTYNKLKKKDDSHIYLSFPYKSSSIDIHLLNNWSSFRHTIQKILK